MKKLFYPVVFHPEESGYSANVPDLDGCCSQGETLDETVEMIAAAIGLYLSDEKAAPAPSDPATIIVNDKDFLMVVPYDEMEYRQKYDTKVVKKTLSIPSWLNEAAKAAHINFSSVLQEGLKNQLDLDDR